MKSRKFLTLAIVFMLALTCVMFMPKNTNFAQAKMKVAEKIAGYSYDLSYIAKESGVESISGKTLKYRLIQLLDGTDVAENDETYGDFAKFTTCGTTIEFTKHGVYTFEVYNNQTDLEGSFKVKVVPSSIIDETSLFYNVDSELINAVNTACSDQAKDLKVEDSFSFTNAGVMTALEKIAGSTYFPYSALTKNYYYSTPQSSSYTNTTSSKFTIDKPGTYSFYVLVSDECNNKTSTKDLIEGPGGWYKKDDDGNRIGDIVIPIFTFEVTKISAPVITVAASEAGFLNLEYTVDSFTIDADDYKAEYTLYYSEREFDKDDESFADDNAYIKAVTEDPTTKNVTEELFDKTDKSFTPNKKGYYYVLVRAVDSANMSEQAMSRAISVQREFTTVTVEREFVKNNLVSVIALSVAVVCIIGLIALVCIKPKDYSVELEVKNNKNNK